MKILIRFVLFELKSDKKGTFLNRLKKIAIYPDF